VLKKKKPLYKPSLSLREQVYTEQRWRTI